MKNLAGSSEATLRAVEELAAAKIPLVPARDMGGEVASAVEGELRAGLHSFHFVRRWAYWSASCAPGLPADVASRLNATPCNSVGTHYSGRPGTLGAVARAHGYAGGMEEEQLRKWGACDSWHIDTPEGLAAFAAWLVSEIGPPLSRKCETCGGKGVVP